MADNVPAAMTEGHHRFQPEAAALRHFPAPWHVDPLTASIYATDVPKGPARVADMRGWGYLTGKGHGALALSQDEAIDIQRANAAFLVAAVNSYAALVAVAKMAKAAAEMELGIAPSPDFSPRDMLYAACGALGLPLEGRWGAT